MLNRDRKDLLRRSVLDHIWLFDWYGDRHPLAGHLPMSNYIIAGLAILCIAEFAYIWWLSFIVTVQHKAILAATAQVTNMVRGLAN